MGSYQSRKNRNDMSNNNGTEEQSFASTGAKKKQEEKESTKKLAKTAGKGAATYFGGPAGNPCKLCMPWSGRYTDDAENRKRFLRRYNDTRRSYGNARRHICYGQALC